MDIDQLRSQTREIAPPRERRSIIGPLLAAVAVGALVIAGVVLWLSRSAITGSDAHQVAVTFIEQDEVLARKLGDEITLGFMPRGTVRETDDGGGEAKIIYSVTGSSAEGRVRVVLERTEGQWELVSAVLDGADGPLSLEVDERRDPSLPSPQAEHHVLRGAQLVNAGRASEGIKELELAVTLDADYADAWYWRGRAHQEMDHWQRAYDDFESAIALDSELADAHEGAAFALGQLDRWEDALPHLDEYVELKPESGEAWLARGHALYKLDRTDEALRDLSKSCDLGHQPGCEARDKIAD